MKALCWHGNKDVRYGSVPDPCIKDPRDAIVKVTSCVICGSDLHLYDGFMMGMESGDILGHEFIGEVVEVGAADHRLKVGDRVVSATASSYRSRSAPAAPSLRRVSDVGTRRDRATA